MRIFVGFGAFEAKLAVFLLFVFAIVFPGINEAQAPIEAIVIIERRLNC